MEGLPLDSRRRRGPEHISLAVAEVLSLCGVHCTEAPDKEFVQRSRMEGVGAAMQWLQRRYCDPVQDGGFSTRTVQLCCSALAAAVKDDGSLLSPLQHWLKSVQKETRRDWRFPIAALKQACIEASIPLDPQRRLC